MACGVNLAARKTGRRFRCRLDGAFTSARRRIRICNLGLLLSVRFAGGPMKKAFLGLLLIAGWLACFPAYATTYTYNVDYTFTTTPGQVTGSIVSSCDSCVLTPSNVLSWSFTASDRTSGSSSGPTAGINALGVHAPSDANRNLDGYEPDRRRIFRVLQRHIEQWIGLLQYGGTECRQYLSRAGSAIPVLAYQLGGKFVGARDFRD